MTDPGHSAFRRARARGRGEHGAARTAERNPLDARLTGCRHTARSNTPRAREYWLWLPRQEMEAWVVRRRPDGWQIELEPFGRTGWMAVELDELAGWIDARVSLAFPGSAELPVGAQMAMRLAQYHAAEARHETPPVGPRPPLVIVGCAWDGTVGDAQLTAERSLGLDTGWTLRHGRPVCERCSNGVWA